MVFRLAELVDAVSSKLIYCWFESSNEQGYRLIGRTAVFGTADVGSSPTTPKKKITIIRVWCNGNITVLGTVAVGSSPTTQKRTLVKNI